MTLLYAKVVVDELHQHQLTVLGQVWYDLHKNWACSIVVQIQYAIQAYDIKVATTLLCNTRKGEVDMFPPSAVSGCSSHTFLQNTPFQIRFDASAKCNILGRIFIKNCWSRLCQFLLSMNKHTVFQQKHVTRMTRPVKSPKMLLSSNDIDAKVAARLPPEHTESRIARTSEPEALQPIYG